MEPEHTEHSLAVSFSLGERTFSGRMEEGTDPVLRVNFEHGTAPFLPLEDAVALDVTGGALAEPVTIQAVPKAWHSSEEGDRVFFDVDEAERLRITEAMLRQRSLRIPLRGARALRVGIRTLAGDLAFDAALVDISKTGAGLVVSDKWDRRLCDLMLGSGDDRPEWALELYVEPPEAERGSTVIAEIRYRRLCTGYVKYGLRFDQERTDQRFGSGAAKAEELFGFFESETSQAA